MITCMIPRRMHGIIMYQVHMAAMDVILLEPSLIQRMLINKLNNNIIKSIKLNSNCNLIGCRLCKMYATASYLFGALLTYYFFQTGECTS